MKVTVYVNHGDEKVITEKEYLERLNKAVDEMVEDNQALAKWLEDNYSPFAIWEATPEKREKILKEWRENCRDYIENDGDMIWWQEYELEV